MAFEPLPKIFSDIQHDNVSEFKKHLSSSSSSTHPARLAVELHRLYFESYSFLSFAVCTTAVNIVQYLVNDVGADVNSTFHGTHAESTVLHSFIRQSSRNDLSKSYQQKLDAIFNTLITRITTVTIDTPYRSDDNARMFYSAYAGKTCLRIAIERQSVLNTERLLKAGANPHLASGCESSPLTPLAVLSQSVGTVPASAAHKRILIILLKYGARYSVDEFNLLFTDQSMRDTFNSYLNLNRFYSTDMMHLLSQQHFLKAPPLASLVNDYVGDVTPLEIRTELAKALEDKLTLEEKSSSRCVIL